MNIATQIRIGAQRIFGLLFICIACIFGTMATTESAFAACGENQIDILGDGTQCETAKFTLTTTNLSANDTFLFSMSASGTFYVDCGTDGTLSGTGASDKTITRSDATPATYTCTYSSAGTKTIRFGGTATGYNENYWASAISFGRYYTSDSDSDYVALTPAKIASISGNLSEIFPWLSGNTADGAAPRFKGTFRNATNLRAVPDTLFVNYTADARSMFSGTFAMCAGLTSIPATLFSGITTGAPYMFHGTFSGCTGLTSIPAGLFSGINKAVSNLFYMTFYGCRGLTSIPAGLFSHMTSTSSSDWAFYATFKGCTGLTSITAGLFANINNAAPQLFAETFSGCTNLSGYIPSSTFAGLIANNHPTATDMWVGTFTNTNVATSCPVGTTQYITGYEGDTAGTTWNGKVSCEQASTLAVTLDDTDANTAATPATVYLNYGDAWYSDANATTAITGLTTLPTKTDRVFGGYYTGQNGAGTRVIDKNGDFVTTNPQLTAATLYPLFWESKFTLTTTNLAANDEFKFNMSATGTFYVDCGADGVLSGTGADGDKITRTNTTETTYTCTYSTAGARTLQFGGLATGYNTGNSVATIRFYTGTIGYQYVVGGSEHITSTSVAAISGLLGSIFPTLGNGDSNSKRPKFEGTFMNSQIQSIPENLFSGVSGPAYRGFYFAFAGCTGLTSIPENLFSGLSGASGDMFAYTFYKCTGLTSIPENLFAGFRGAADAMFSDTFGDCTGLTSIPDNLFSGLSGAAGRMFAYTFAGCTGLTSIPDNLFAGLSGAAERMFEYTFAFCRGLTSIPENLFAGATTSAARMFRYTFDNCTNLIGYIPATTFSGLISNNHPTATDMWSNTFSSTNIATTCPAGTVQYMTGYEGTGTTTWDGKVSCTDVQTVTYSCGDATGTPPANSAVVTGSTFVPAENSCSKPGYVFYGWGVSGTNDTVMKPFTWNYSGNKTLTAQWGLGKFNLTTTNLNANDEFKFTMTAAGTFTVDCGADGTLTSSANDVTDGNTITRNNVTQATYTCTYTTGGVKTIVFDGTATNYNNTYQDSENNYYAAIAFTGINKDVTTEPLTPTKIASISGNLSSIFPYISGNAAGGAQPRFYRLFSGAKNLTTVPDTLFADYTKGAVEMFSNTFRGCTGLQSIPAGLFSGITTGARTMFSNTFRGCTGLTSIPAGLFSNITTGAQYLFYATFYGCTGLTSIPAGLFSGITTSASNMFEGTFRGCTGLTSIPAGLFSGITTGASYMFYFTFAWCTGLTSIPAGLFSGITTGAEYMFYSTFYSCTGLTSIPAGLFSGIKTGVVNMFRSTFDHCTGLTSIPAGLFSNITTGATEMFYATFADCSKLTSVPADLFSNITTGATGMFYATFSGCTGLTSIPADLFSGITTGADQMFFSTFANCTELTSIPADLFSNITTGAVQMFRSTFNGCSNLSGYVSPLLFAGLIANGSPTATDMWIYTFYGTKLATSCPAGTVQYMTGYEGTGATTWNGKVSCVPDSENTTSTVTYSCGDATGTPPANSAVVTGSTFVPAENSCSKPGYVFYGWGVSGTNDMVIKPFTWNYSGNKTLTAQWGLGKFNLTTTNLNANDEFKFTMTAAGTFTVDCGADGVLSSSADDITNGNTITRNNVTQATYTCTYSTGGVKTIAFDGTATNYSTAYQDSDNNYYAAIAFSGINKDVTTEPLTPTKIASVAGNLSAIFPYISGNSASVAQPRFVSTFRSATNLTTVPDTLFADYTKGATQMFSNTFRGCTGLTSIPADLFSGITTGASYMFVNTFFLCTGLTSIPAGLFSSIKTGASNMFYSTFNGCTRLTSIPADLFSGITTGASYMFYGTFASCTSLTTIPADLFSGIKTGASNIFYQTFYNCTGLTSIPAGLFSGITKGADYMFNGAFNGCTGLQSIPAGLFSGIKTGAAHMFRYTFNRCTGLKSIPAGLFSGITTGASNMFYGTFYGCTGLTSIPADLFSGIKTGADNMFAYTFKGCTNLTGYIPPSTFAGLIVNGSPTATDMWLDTFTSTKLATSCPTGTTQYITGYEGTGTTTWNGKVSCVSDSENTTSTVTYSCGDATGTAPANQAAVSGEIFVPAENSCSKPGYVFYGWGVSGTNDTVMKPFTWNYSGNKTLTAQWGLGRFNLTTTNLSDGDVFKFTMTAAGTFTVDCGTDGVLSSSADDITDGNTITRSNTTIATYTCTYSTGGVKTIAFDGTATNYSTAYQDSANNYYAAIAFSSINYDVSTESLTPTKIASVAGNLSSIFPYISGNAASGAQPRFHRLFGGATNLTAVPDTLFADYTKGATHMFVNTFRSCTGLTSIPSGLFSGITTGADNMFAYTFYNCTGLTSIPAGLFSGITTGANYMFQHTFYECTGLTTITADLFSGITTGAAHMFSGTFQGCTGLTSIPAGLFSGITTGAGYMFYSTFYGCTSLTTIPSDLFSRITTGASNMFYDTFNRCSGLQSIPAGLFSGIKTGAEGMFRSTFNRCTGLTSIPAGLFSSITTGANLMFYATFYWCTGLTSIPAGLFSSITTGANLMFHATFYLCTGLTSIPAGLFSGITTGASSMFTNTFSGCTGLTTIPADLFSGITTGADSMFYQTFDGCSKLSGYIPPSTFAGLIANGSPTATDMWAETFNNTKLATSCPAGTVQYMTGYEGTGATTWNGKVSCVEYPNQLCNPGEYLPNTASVCQPCTENSYCTGGTFTVNTAGAQGIDMCPNDWYSPAGMSSVDQCGRILHIGDSVVYLRSAKKTTPSLNVDLDNDGVADFFGNMTTLDVPITNGTESKLKLQYGGQTYSVYDDSVNVGE